MAEEINWQDIALAISELKTEIIEAMATGFKESADSNAELHLKFGILNERVVNVIKVQEELGKEVNDMKDIKDEVKVNTQFRKGALRVLWIIIGVVVTALTLNALGLSW